MAQSLYENVQSSVCPPIDIYYHEHRHLISYNCAKVLVEVDGGDGMCTSFTLDIYGEWAKRMLLSADKQKEMKEERAKNTNLFLFL